MADGSTKPISEVEVGDEVLAADPETGETVAKPVLALIGGDGDKNLVQISIADETEGKSGGVDGVIVATDTHPFWVENLDRWIDATDLKPGMWLRTSAGTFVQATAIKRWTAPQRVHNLTIADIHTYYVLAGNTPVLVHNDKCPVTGNSHGDMGELATYERLLKDGYTSIEREVAFLNSKGNQFIVDFGASDSNGNWIAVEVKTGRRATITPNQAAGYPEINGAAGAILNSKKLAQYGLPKGSRVHFPVEFDAWKCPHCQ